MARIRALIMRKGKSPRVGQIGSYQPEAGNCRGKSNRAKESGSKPGAIVAAGVKYKTAPGCSARACFMRRLTHCNGLRPRGAALSKKHGGVPGLAWHNRPVCRIGALANARYVNARNRLHILEPGRRIYANRSRLISRRFRLAATITICPPLWCCATPWRGPAAGHHRIHRYR